MANLDISIIFITLVVSLLLTVLGYAMREWLLYLFSAIYGMMVVSYFGNNYSLVNTGIFTISFFPVFTLMYVFLCLVFPLILLWRNH